MLDWAAFRYDAALQVASGVMPQPQSPSETHRFVPQQFYNTYSAMHPPALRIKPGDRVSTKTVDAAGVDSDGKTVASPSNPQTGAFYVEGAEPDDTLVVTFNF